MTWRRDVDRRREQARAEYPRWMETGRLPPLGRLARVVGRVGGALGLWAAGRRRKGPPHSRRDLSRRLRIAFGHLGPTYIKLGQIVSGGEGLFPRGAGRRVQVAARPRPARVVRRRAARSSSSTSAARSTTCSRRSSAHRSRRRRSPRCTRRACAPAKTSSSRCSARRSRASYARTSRRCRGSRPTSSGASRSPRSRTRPRSSSCSRRRSSRSSTSGSKRRTCSTSRASSPRPSSARRSFPGRIRRW